MLVYPQTHLAECTLPTMSLLPQPETGSMLSPAPSQYRDSSLLNSSDYLITLHRTHSLVLVLPGFAQVLSIHCLTPTHEAAETMLQQFWLAPGHFLKDDLVVVASVFFDAGSNSLQTFTAGRAASMLATLLQPELFHGSSDLLLYILIRTFMLVYDRLVRDEEDTHKGWLLAILGPVKRQEQLHQLFIARNWRHETRIVHDCQLSGNLRILAQPFFNKDRLTFGSTHFLQRGNQIGRKGERETHLFL